MSRNGSRVQDAPAYLLHASAWRETSLVVQVFSRHHGHVALVAKGAKRPYSTLRPVLMAFQPLLLSWTGQGEVKILTRAESAGVRLLGGRALMSAWYMNELLLRLLAREDAHPAVYEAYDAALRELAGDAASSGVNVAAALRRFEWILLEEAGYGEGGDVPAFTDPKIEAAARPALRQRLNALLERPLQTRRVLHALVEAQGRDRPAAVMLRDAAMGE